MVFDEHLRANTVEEIKELRRRTWGKKAFEQLYGRGSYNKLPFNLPIVHGLGSV